MTTSPSSTKDFIIDFSTYIVDKILEGDSDVHIVSWYDHFTIPPHATRIWIYERDIQFITLVAQLNRETGTFNRLYQLSNPLAKEALQECYNIQVEQIPVSAPLELAQDYWEQLCRVW